MMPVGEDGRMIGTISDRDIAIRAVAEGKDAGTKVRDVMAEGIAWAYEDDSVEQAALIMSEPNCGVCPSWIATSGWSASWR